MNNKIIAKRLNKIAKELLSVDFPNQKAMNDYLKQHPKADRKNHKVVEFKPKQSIINNQQIAESLYRLNKYCKLIRDENNELKDKLFGGEGTFETSMGAEIPFQYLDNKIKEQQMEISNIEIFIDDKESELNILEVELEDIESEQEQCDDMKEELKDKKKEIKDIESEIKDSEEELEFEKKYLEELEQFKTQLDEMHDKIKYYSDENTRKQKLYDLKEKILVKYGEKTNIKHKFKNDENNVYRLYKLGSLSFHIKEDAYVDEDFSKLEELNNITSQSGLGDFSIEDEKLLIDLIK